MSNLSDTKKPIQKSDSRCLAIDTALDSGTEPAIGFALDDKGLGTPAQTASPPMSKRWSFIQNDLSKAMDTWQELEKAEISLSPEEEQLVKIKQIIAQLKEKLEHF